MARRVSDDLDPEAAEAARAERSSDAHDPAAKDSWLGLLSFLSDAELARYGEIAGDQALQERRRIWLQIASLVIGTGLLAYAAFVAYSGAKVGLAVLLALIGLAAEYWPYQKAKARRLWASHVQAVEAEQRRRAQSHEAHENPRGFGEGEAQHG